MQLIVIEDAQRTDHRPLVEAMLRLRTRVFAERLRWQVHSQDGLERDAFDDARPTYIVLAEDDNHVIGCVRLLPPQRASMLMNVFPQLVDGRLKPHERMIESSRFCIDKALPGEDLPARHRTRSVDQPQRPASREGASLIHPCTRLLLAGIVEWSLAHGYLELVTATDLRFERLLKMAGWPLCRLGSPRLINETCSIAGSLEISQRIFRSLKPDGYRSLLPAGKR